MDSLFRWESVDVHGSDGFCEPWLEICLFWPAFTEEEALLQDAGSTGNQERSTRNTGLLSVALSRPAAASTLNVFLLPAESWRLMTKTRVYVEKTVVHLSLTSARERLSFSVCDWSCIKVAGLTLSVWWCRFVLESVNLNTDNTCSSKSALYFLYAGSSAQLSSA